MPCIWNDARCNYPPPGVKILAKYNTVRSDIPFEYVVAHFDLSWRTWYMVDGHLMESIIPKPDWWALIEPEDDHG